MAAPKEKNMINKVESIEDELIIVAVQRYGIPEENLFKHGSGYQNLVYEYRMNDKDYILRLSKSTTRSYEEILSELSFLQHLSNHEVSVSLPVKSLHHEFVEKIQIDENKYYAVAFEKALGDHIVYPDYLDNQEMFYELGKLTGRLHKASKAFPVGLNSRIHWEDNYYLKHATSFIPTKEIEKIDAFKAQIAEMMTIEKNDKNFGLIHGDINVGNFFSDDGRITLFDFDECQNSWYVEDIAIQLFYTVYVFCDDSLEERQKKAIEFMNHFLKGYRTENDIEIEMLKLIPKFLVLREMIVHVGIYKMWDLSKLEGWADDYYKESSRRIIDRTPIVDFDRAWCDE